MPKSREKLYYSISEVAEIGDVKPHVLRYWESQFKVLKPKKNRAGNRMYRPRDLNLVLTIRDLLYRNGYTTAGARRKLLDARRRGELENGLLASGAEAMPAEDAGAADEEAGGSASRAQLTLADAARLKGISEVKTELRSLLDTLESQPRTGG